MAKHIDQLSELIAFEEKLMGELPLNLCRVRMERVKPFYIERHGIDAARRIFTAMRAKLIARRGPR